MATVYDHGERHYDTERELEARDERIRALELELELLRGRVDELERRRAGA